MRTFYCLITDDRNTAPTLAIFVLPDDALAREMALRRLLESPHHHQIELIEDGLPIFTRTRLEASA